MTFLNVHQSIRKAKRRYTKQGGRTRTTEPINENHDKMKDDAIAHLSDQHVAITGRLQELERRQIRV